MLKIALKTALCGLILSAFQPAHCSVTTSATSNKSWTWLSCATLGLAAITPYFAYKYYESRKAEPAAKKKDDEINAVAKTVEDKLKATEEITEADVSTVRAMSDRYPTPIFSTPQRRRQRFSESVSSYNKERNEKNRSEVSSQLYQLPAFCYGIQRGPVFLDRQQDSTSNYALLTGLSGLTAAGLYLYGRK